MTRFVTVLVTLAVALVGVVPAAASDEEYDPSTNPDAHNPPWFTPFAGEPLEHFDPPTEPGLYGTVPEDGTVDLYVYVGSDADSAGIDQAVAAFQQGVGEGSPIRNTEWWPGFFFTAVPVTPGLDDRLAGMLNSPLIHSIVVLPQFETTATHNRNVSAGNRDSLDGMDGNVDGYFRSDYTGNGVRIYVIDTGVDPLASELAGRVQTPDFLGDQGINNPGKDYMPFCPYPAEQHGTAMAVVAAGTNDGIAPNATIISLGGALNEAGNNQPVDCAVGVQRAYDSLTWIRDFGIAPAVINVSFNSTYTYLDQQNAASKDKVTYEVWANLLIDLRKAGFIPIQSAGNDGEDRCTPATGRSQLNEYSLIVGGLGSTGFMHGSSNRGDCVDLWAPWDWEVTRGSGATSHTETIGGTSPAAAAVSGTVSLYLEWAASELHLGAQAPVSTDMIKSLLLYTGDPDVPGNPGTESRVLSTAENGFFSDDNTWPTGLEANIDWIAWREITLGSDPNNPSLFNPSGNVLRMEALLFLYRAYASPAALPNVFNPIPAANPYTDVYDHNGLVLEAPMGWMIQNGAITSGCSSNDPNLFCPWTGIRRHDFVLWMYRLEQTPTTGSPDGDPAFNWNSGASTFTDISSLPQEHQDAIAWAEANGITLGCSDPGKFCPYDLVSRGETSAFLRRALTNGDYYQHNTRSDGTMLYYGSP